MFFINSWGTPDRRILVYIKDEVLVLLFKYVQCSQLDCEAGGILLGTVHGEHLIITEATEPTQKDKRLKCFFERLQWGHAWVAHQRWHASNGIMRYLGEWHTHPESIPTPSYLDRNEWRYLASKRIDQRPVLSIIVGQNGLHVELTPSRGTFSTLFPAT